MKKITGLLITFFMFASLQVFAGTQEAKIKGMTCGSCEKKVKAALMKFEQVASVNVSSKTGTAVITLKEGQTISEEKLSAAIKEAGFKLQSLHVKK
jgi:copper chaperone CopZ